MSHRDTAPQASPSWASILFALFGLFVIATLFRLGFGGIHSDMQVVLRECAMLAFVAVLVGYVRRREGFTPADLGFGQPWWRSALRGLGLALVTIVLIVVLYVALKALGISLGQGDAGEFRPSVLATSLMMLRAGVTEEICFRGYAIEALRRRTGSLGMAAAISAIVFALLHYRQGIGGVIVAAGLGALYTLYYLRRRDLQTMIVGHATTDFVFNVVLPLLGGD